MNVPFENVASLQQHLTKKFTNPTPPIVIVIVVKLSSTKHFDILQGVEMTDDIVFSINGTMFFTFLDKLSSNILNLFHTDCHIHELTFEIG